MTNSAFGHLSESASKLLSLSSQERINRIRAPRWIGYPRAKEILNKLEDLLSYPQADRMPNLLIVGETNNGKTMLVNRFKKTHPADDNPSGEGISVPVMVIQAPPIPDENRFYNTILESLFAPYKAHDRVDKKQFQAIKLLRYVGLRMLIIDEIHHILAGSLNKQRAFLNVIKFLGNELKISIVGVGIKDAFRAIQTDPQLANRFEPALLPLWTVDEEFMRLLASFERMLPLKKASNLHDMSLATKIHSMSEGHIGEISRLLTEAASLAIENGMEQINAKVLDSVDWSAPSDRRRRLEGKR